MSNRLVPCELALRLLGRALAVADGLRSVLRGQGRRLEEVMRKRGGVALDVVSVQPFQRARDRAVQPHLSGDREFAEQRLLHQRVGGPRPR